MKTSDKLRAFFENNPKQQGETDLSYFTKAAEACGTTHNYVNTFYYKYRKKKNRGAEGKEYILDDDLYLRKKDARIKELERHNEILKDRLQEAEDRFDTLINIKEPVTPDDLPQIEQSTTHEAVPIISISDIHLEESVNADIVNQLNEYNPEIAEARVKSLFLNALKLVKMFQKDVDINTVVIALLGDNITGYIHEELMESNTLSPTEATIMVKKILIEGIKYFADTGMKIVIPCARGNHGRTTSKKRFSTGYKNSFEWMMYCDMQNFFTHAGYTNVEFIISKSEYTYLKIFDYNNRFCHGDHFKFAGGIGGIFPSMFKFLTRINEGIEADCTFMGHWHQYYAAARKGFVVNGSVIGTNAYGMNYGNDVPVQNIQLLDSKYGYTGNFPIVL